MDLKAPKNQAVQVIKIILDGLIEDVGVEVVEKLAIAEVPFLGWPVIHDLFSWALNLLAGYINENAFDVFSKLAIRLQNDSRKKAYDEAIAKLLNPEASEDDVEEARRAIDDLVNRNRP